MQVNIRDLIVTQNSLRDFKQVVKMVEFAKAGGMFTRDARLAQSLLSDTGRGVPPPIHIAVMEDGQMLLHDGHHRAVSLFLGQRDILDPAEYEVGHYSYDDYLLPNPDKGWFTPFDPRIECRLSDFWKIKKQAQFVYSLSLIEPLNWRQFIKYNKHKYVEPRTISTVQQLTEKYLNA